MGLIMDMPIQIKLLNSNTLRIDWGNGVRFDYPLNFLRENSPDAENKIVKIKDGNRNIKREGKNSNKFKIKNIELMGNYAIRIFWEDGFSDGIYPWDLLYKLGRYLEVTSNLHQDFEDEHADKND